MNTKALRQKILDLAIHGKLVPQDPNDEPASVLLERIRTEKERLIKEGKIKKPKKSKATCDKPRYPFELPNGWVWCKLEDIAYVASGSTPEKSSFVAEGIPYIKMYNLRNQEIDFDYKPQYIKEEVHNGKLQRSRTEIGDLIMNIVGPPLGKLALIPRSLPQANFNQAAVLIRPYLYKNVINVYLKAYLEEMSEINSISTKGSAGQVNISLTQSQNMRIPLPPLQEQIRINNELRVWLTVVQQIEEGRETLNLAIKQAKSKILDLAIHGKLVPQEPNDEPAADLLKRINPKAEITCDTPRYGKLPDTWVWTTVREITKSILYGVSESAKNKGEYKLLRITDIQNNSVDWNTVPYTDYDEHKAIKYLINNGDILFARTGATVGKSYLVEGVRDKAIYASYLIRVQTYKEILPEYVKHFFESSFYWEQIQKDSVGIGQPNVNGTILSQLVIPLPPLSEQHRIVAKIEELFAQLDKIESSL